jgi:hypothetical protein
VRAVHFGCVSAGNKRLRFPCGHDRRYGCGGSDIRRILRAQRRIPWKKSLRSSKFPGKRPWRFLPQPLVYCYTIFKLR